MSQQIQQHHVMPITHTLTDRASTSPNIQKIHSPSQTDTNTNHNKASSSHSEVNRSTQDIKNNRNLSSLQVPTVNFQHTPEPKMQKNVKLSQIIRRRNELNNEITRLKYEEQKSKQKSPKGFDRNMRSQLTQQEKNRIKKQLQARRIFQNNNELKLKQLEQKIQEEEMLKQKQMRQKIQSIRTKNKFQAMKQLQNLKIKQIDRVKTIKQGNMKFEEIKHKSFLHQKIQQKWKQKIKNNQISNKQFLQSIKKQKQFKISQIKKHQFQYKQFLQNEGSSRKDRIRQQSKEKIKIQKITLTKYTPTVFLKTIFEEQQKKKEEQKMKQMQILAYKNKIMQFSQTIKDLNKQKIAKNKQLTPIKQQNNDNLIPDKTKNKQPQKGRSLSQIQLLKLGNDYMRQIHSSIGTLEPTLSNVKLSDIKRQQVKLQDYLRIQRQKRVKLNPQIKQIRQLKALMKKDAPLDDKLYYAKLLANRLEERTGSDTQMLLKSITTKINIINQFTSN